MFMYKSVQNQRLFTPITLHISRSVLSKFKSVHFCCYVHDLTEYFNIRNEKQKTSNNTISN